ncbi:MAG: YodC family protein [Candidatus Sulfotelmatobacter sp.]
MPQFQVGDVVQLKSGGLKMIVTDVGDFEGKPTVWCSWTYRKDQKRSNYPPEALKLAEE